MTRLLEHHSLDMVRRAGVPVAPYFAVDTPKAAAEAARSLGGRTILKVLVPKGGRGRAGGVVATDSPAAAEQAAEALLGHKHDHFPVRQVLVQRRVEVAHEYFCAITYDSSTRGPVVLFSRAGGIDVEDLVTNEPGTLVTRSIATTSSVPPYVAREIAESAGLHGDGLISVAATVSSLCQVFHDADAALVEVNPLAVDGSARPIALSAVVVIDDQAAFRHAEWVDILGGSLSNGWRPLTALEHRIREIDALDTGSAIRFNEFPEGRIACMLTGGGSGMVALDHFARLGELPATTFDITPGRVEEKMYLATKAILSRPGIMGLIAGGNITNFIPIDIKARGVVRALKELAVDARRFPVVFRYAGPGVDLARDLAAEVPGIEFHDERTSLEAAVERIVIRVREVAQ